MRCTTGRCGRPVRWRVFCWCFCCNTWIEATVRLIFGIDETLERRRGPKIKARGIYRDAVRSSRHQLVKASGLRWISLMWLGHDPLGGTPLGLASTHRAGTLRPGTTSGKDARTRRSPTGPVRWSCSCAAGSPSVNWCWWGTTATRCWICSTAASLSVEPVTLIARLRLDAALYAPTPPRQPGQKGRPPLKGPRRPSLESIARSGTDVKLD